MKRLELTQGKFAIVDDSDFDWLNQHKWFYEKTGYASRRKDHRSLRMHRVILDAPETFEVDHINGNGLDNRRENLRLCLHKENIRNARLRKDNTSGFKGVTWHSYTKKWHARVWVDGKSKSLGYYEKREDAAKAYNEGAKKHFGKYARTNKNITA